MTFLKSFRTSTISEFLQSGKDSGSISIGIEKPSAHRVVIGINQNRKLIKVDENLVTQKNKYPFLGQSVSFVPDDLYLMKGGPDGRREFMDDLGITLEPGYRDILKRFQTSLKQRNTVLRAIKEGESRFSELLTWTDEFVRCAVPVYEERLDLTRRLNEILPQIFHNLFNVSEKVSVSYETNLPEEASLSDALFSKLNRLSEAERAVGYGLVGPHRDDFLFKINHLEARSYASQGQMRGMVIALKVAQIELSRTHRNGSPILLLDDIISELDEHRVQSLIEFLASYPGQLFVTTAEVNKVRSLHRQFSSFKVIDLGAEISLKMPQKDPQNLFS